MSRKTKRICDGLEGMGRTLGALTELCHDGGDHTQCRETLAGIDHQAARDALAILDSDAVPDKQRQDLHEFGNTLMRAMMSVMFSA